MAWRGKGSWYSQLPEFGWRDTGDKPGSNALGVPDEEQGIALPSRKTLGQWFDVRGPDGNVHRLQQTDVGPAGWTGRGIDISAAAAHKMGYTPKTFPTDAKFEWQPASGDAPETGSIAQAPQGNRRMADDYTDKGLLSRLGYQPQEQMGGLLGGMEGKLPYLAMIAKGLSPYSSLDPNDLFRVAETQRNNALKQQEFLFRQQEAAQNRDLREREFDFRGQEAARQQSNTDRTFSENQLTPAAKAARDFGHKPGTPEYNDFLQSFYQLKGEGYNPVTIEDGNGEKRTVFQDKRGNFKTPEQVGIPASQAPQTGGDAIPPPPPGSDPREWRKKQTDMRAARDAAKPAREADATRVLEDLDRASKLVDNKEGFLPTTGLVGGQVLSNVGNTAAHDLSTLLTSIGASISFDKLQEMRQNSPTGAALGPVSDKENALLQASLGSIKQSQTPEELKFNINRLKERYEEIIHAPVRGARKGKDGGWYVPDPNRAGKFLRVDQ